MTKVLEEILKLDQRFLFKTRQGKKDPLIHPSTSQLNFQWKKNSGSSGVYCQTTLSISSVEKDK